MVFGILLQSLFSYGFARHPPELPSGDQKKRFNPLTASAFACSNKYYVMERAVERKVLPSHMQNTRKGMEYELRVQQALEKAYPNILSLFGEENAFAASFDWVFDHDSDRWKLIMVSPQPHCSVKDTGEVSYQETYDVQYDLPLQQVPYRNKRQVEVQVAEKDADWDVVNPSWEEELKERRRKKAQKAAKAKQKADEGISKTR